MVYANTGMIRFWVYGIFYDLDAVLHWLKVNVFKVVFDGYVCLGVGFCRE